MLFGKPRKRIGVASIPAGRLVPQIRQAGHQRAMRGRKQSRVVTSDEEPLPRSTASSSRVPWHLVRIYPFEPSKPSSEGGALWGAIFLHAKWFVALHNTESEP